MDERRRYELYVVFQPDLDDEGVESRIDRVNSAITSNQGEIIEVARRGKRKLAYPINRHTHGIDVLYQANLVGTSVEGLERLFNLSEDVIRYLFVRREDLEKAARQSAAPRPAEETPAPAASEEGAAARTVDPTEQPQPMEEFAAEGGAAAPAASEEGVAPSDDATPVEEAPAEEAVAISDEAAPAEEAAVEAPVATSDEDAAAPSDTASNE